MSDAEIQKELDDYDELILLEENFDKTSCINKIVSK